MSLYLAIFDGTREVVGWVLGHYSDFGVFRDTVARTAGASKYPTLMSHSDSDGEWSVTELNALRIELNDLAREFRRHPPEDLVGGFEHSIEQRASATNLYECFHNVEGINIFEALIGLCTEGEQRCLPVLFQ
jgi:hypothetical protein